MLKLRLKKYGKKRQTTYRIVVIPSTSKRDGKSIEELGFYNPHTNETNLNVPKIKARLNQGAKPTPTVRDLLKKAAILS